MPRGTAQHVTEGDFTPDQRTGFGRDLKQAASRWAGEFRESARTNLVKAGYQTETYIRSHPGRFIAGACCVGLAAGWLIGRGTKKA